MSHQNQIAIKMAVNLYHCATLTFFANGEMKVNFKKPVLGHSGVETYDTMCDKEIHYAIDCFYGSLKIMDNIFCKDRESRVFRSFIKAREVSGTTNKQNNVLHMS